VILERPRRAMQLLSNIDHTTVDLVDNENGMPSSALAEPLKGKYPTILNGTELIDLAQGADGAGFEVRAFELVDEFGRHVSEDFSRKSSNSLKRALVEGGRQGIQALLRHELHGYVISGVELWSEETRVVTIRRNGVVLTRAPGPVLRLMERSWRRQQ
jgi:hypothetical protein